MHTYILQVTVSQDSGREISVHLPDDFPSGPAEVIVLAAPRSATEQPFQLSADALQELLSFQATPDEESILDAFETFQGEHPFRLSSLDEEP